MQSDSIAMQLIEFTIMITIKFTTKSTIEFTIKFIIKFIIIYDLFKLLMVKIRLGDFLTNELAMENQ